MGGSPLGGSPLSSTLAASTLITEFVPSSSLLFPCAPFVLFTSVCLLRSSLLCPSYLRHPFPIPLASSLSQPPVERRRPGLSERLVAPAFPTFSEPHLYSDVPLVTIVVTVVLLTKIVVRAVVVSLKLLVATVVVVVAATVVVVWWWGGRFVIVAVVVMVAGVVVLHPIIVCWCFH